MQERLDHVWDEDGTYGYAFNFGYSLRYLEDASNHAHKRIEDAPEDDAEELVAVDDDSPRPSLRGPRKGR